MEETQRRDPREYLGIARRRAVLMVATAAVVGAVAAGLAVSLPSIYRSSATVLVQEQEIPPDLVRSTITSFADERIQVISQQVMTRAVLLELAEKYDLFPASRAQGRTEDVLDRMRRDIRLTTVNSDVSDRSSGRRVNATIAFRISFDAPKPEQAQAVVNDLVSLYLNENAKARQRSVAETTAFLSEEAERLERQIQATEAKLAEFKRRNAGRLPESTAVNMQLAERTESELLRIDRDMSMLQDRRLYVESQLSLVKPHLPPAVAAAEGTARALSPEDRLRSLEAEFAGVSAKYGPEHPDVRRLRREIAALRAETGVPAAGTGAAERRKALEAELATLREKYSEDHPDVQRVRRSIAGLKPADAAETPGDAARARPSTAAAPDNPAYLSLVNQLESTKRELAQLAQLKDDLRSKQRTYDSRLLQIPEIEREYRDLTRDYENAQTRYREVRSKQMQAEVAQELERDRKGQRFTLGEPANLPESPVSPNRPRIALIGVLASLGGGIGLGWLRDLLDPSIKGPRELARIARFPLLTAIPYIETREEKVRARRRTLAMAVAAGCLAVLFVAFVHFFLRPLPDIWDGVLRLITRW